jgi:hypothetical protein
MSEQAAKFIGSIPELYDRYLGSWVTASESRGDRPTRHRFRSMHIVSMQSPVSSV